MSKECMKVKPVKMNEYTEFKTVHFPPSRLSATISW